MRGVWSFLACAIGVFAIAQGEPHRPQIIVKFREAPRDLNTFAVQSAVGARMLQFDATRMRSVFEIGSNLSAAEAAAAYRKLPNVAYAEPDAIVRAFKTVNDPLAVSQWGLTNAKVTSAWDSQSGASDVIIAVVDTGVDQNHQDLVSRTVDGFDFVDNDAVPADGNGHGTHCAGIIAANADNSLGGAGVAFGCRVMAIRVLNSSGVGNMSTLVQGIEYAVDHGAKIISLSLGTPSESRAMEESIDYAWDHGVLIVAAAGNESTNRATFPAAYPKVLSVAAYDQNNKRAYFSNFGPWVDVAAPGVQILSTVPDNKYAYMSGTSMATPFVAGVAGLVWSQLGANASPATVSQRIEGTCDAFTPWVTRGRVNALAAMSEIPSPDEFDLQALDTTVTGGSKTRVRVLLKKSSPDVREFIVSSSDAAITAPSTYKIARRQTGGILMLNTSSVSALTPVTLTFTSGAITKTVVVNVKPVAVRDLKFTRPTIVGGKAIMLGIFLDGVSPAGGLALQFSSDDPAVQPPAAYTMRAGIRLVYVTARTSVVTSAKDVTVTLTHGSSTTTTTLKVLPK